jgi:transposase InsO family protein
MKWKNRDFTSDLSSRPKNIVYGLSELEQALVVSIRRSSWIALDEITEMVREQNDKVSRNAIYSCLVRNELNKVPQEKRDKAKKFKAYDPGYLHVDVTYMPKLNGQKYYLFVAIDRATRTLYYAVYKDKSARSTEDFFEKCLAFFPFKITHILTDNGLEFTNKLIRSKTGNLCTKPSKLDIKCEKNNIDHRLTPPSSPQTNGMVERVNGTIKNGTILISDYNSIQELQSGLISFLVFYNINRRHGSLRKELNVKTPLQAVQKWYELKPELFIRNPSEFEQTILNLKQTNYKD